MRALVLILLLLQGCAAAAPYAPAAQAALDTFTKLLRQHGTDEVVIECEHEVHPPKDGKKGRLLMLCEAEL